MNGQAMECRPGTVIPTPRPGNNLAGTPAADRKTMLVETLEGLTAEIDQLRQAVNGLEGRLGAVCRCEPEDPAKPDPLPNGPVPLVNALEAMRSRVRDATQQLQRLTSRLEV